MSERDNGGSAFPQIESRQSGGQGDYWTKTESFGGMALRDYFAAKAMQGDIASMASHQDPAIAGAYIAERAYVIADAMLKARQP